MRHDLDRDRIAQAAPQPDLQLALGDGVLEGVARHIHGGVPYTNCTEMPPSGPKSPCTVSPLAANTTRVNEPASTTWRGSSGVPIEPTLLASHATPIAGWPSTPAAT